MFDCRQVCETGVRRDYNADVRQNQAIVLPEPAHFPIPPLTGLFVSMLLGNSSRLLRSRTQAVVPGLSDRGAKTHPGVRRYEG